MGNPAPAPAPGPGPTVEDQADEVPLASTDISDMFARPAKARGTKQTRIVDSRQQQQQQTPQAGGSVVQPVRRSRTPSPAPDRGALAGGADGDAGGGAGGGRRGSNGGEGPAATSVAPAEEEVIDLADED